MSRNRVSIYGQDAKKSYGISIAASTDNVSVGAAVNQAATVALPAQTAGSTIQGSWVISNVFWSYSQTAVGRLTIADSSGNLFDEDLHTGGAQNFGGFSFQPPLSSQVNNSAITVTLAAGGAAVTGKVSVQGWLEM